MTEQSEPHHVTTVDIDGQRLNVSVAIEYDGVEHVGRLWFAEEEWDDEGLRDHGAISGVDPEHVLANAKRLSDADLTLRYRRAQSEKRRFLGLRRMTEDVLADIRLLNQLATSMRAGLLDVDEAAAEIDATERRLHDMVDKLRHIAGVAT